MSEILQSVHSFWQLLMRLLGREVERCSEMLFHYLPPGSVSTLPSCLEIVPEAHSVAFT